MSAKKAILKAKIENEVVELLIKSRIDNIVLTDDTTTLASKLAEIVSAINDRAKTTDVTNAISKAISDLIAGAPETYDTLKELADYIEAHEEVVTSLNKAIGNKVDKVSGKGLSTNDFTAAYKNLLDGLGSLASKSVVSESDLDANLQAKINASSTSNHSHANKTVLDEVTSERVDYWNGKSKITVATSQPTVFETGDMWIDIS